MTPDNKPAAPGLDEPSDDFDKLSADLTRAKNLLVRLWDKHPAARSQIEACTGTWFAWGTDRDAALSQPVPSAPEPSEEVRKISRLIVSFSDSPTYEKLRKLEQRIAALAAPPVPAAAPAVEPTEAIAQLRHLIDDLVVTYQEDGLERHMVRDGAGLLFSNFVGAVRRLLASLPASPEPATQGAAKPVHTGHPFQHWDRTCPACVLEASPPAPEPLTPAAGEPDERVLNLLARIHRDGGHYVAEHGLHKALQDAEGIVIERIAALDEIAALTTATPGLSDAELGSILARIGRIAALPTEKQGD